MLLDTPSRIAPLPEWLPNRGVVISQTRLASLYERRGPFATVILGVDAGTDDVVEQLLERWRPLRADLEAQGAGPRLLSSIEWRLSQPRPARTRALMVMGAQDGTCVVDYDVYRPPADRATFAPLPEAGPLLEWQQRKIATLVVVLDDQQSHIAGYAIAELSRRYPVPSDPIALARAIARLQEAVDARLVVVVGPEPTAAELAARLATSLPPQCRVVADQPAPTIDDLAMQTLNQVGICEAGITLGFLREQRFLAAHGEAVDGTERTIACLAEGRAGALLIHHRPSDRRTAWIGTRATDLSLRPTDDTPTRVRLTDALIRSAVLQGVAVRIVPALGPSGPEDDVAAVTRISSALLSF